jgi:hypothetical protein
MKPLEGKKVALIGNGPSSTDCGAEIDACDFVVRQARWISQGGKNSGQKVSAICGYNQNTEIPSWLLDRWDWELWCNMSSACFKSEPTVQDPGDWRWLFHVSDGRSIRLARNSIISQTVIHLRYVSKRRKYPPYLDLGLVCIAMAIDLGAKNLHLWGYDRTGFGNPNDDWGQEKYATEKDQLHHDYSARAVMISELVDKQLWCGVPVSIEAVWHGRPLIPKLGTDPELV